MQHIDAGSTVHERINDLSARLHALQAAYAAEQMENRRLREKMDNTKKLSLPEVRRIRSLWDNGSGGWSQRKLADAFDVNPGTISRIVRGIYHAR